MSPRRRIPLLKGLGIMAAIVAGGGLRAEQAASADAFVDSVGVCTHFNYPDTPYGARYPEVRDALVASGIRHVRDAWNPRIPELAGHGIRTQLVVDTESPAEIVAKVRDLLRSAPDAIGAIEGPNEPDIFWERFERSYKGSELTPEGIIAGAAEFQRDLHAAVKGDPATRHLTVIGPALGRTYGYDTGSPFAEGSLAEFVDWGNFHPYPGGNSFSVPFAYGGVEKYLWHGDTPTTGMGEARHAFDVYAPPFAPKPMAASETGYSTFDGGTPEPVQARYVPRLFAEYFRNGIRRTCLYEFVDEFNDPPEREANFGLLRHDLSPKPAYVALQRLLRLLAEPDVPKGWKPGRLECAITVEPVGDYTRTEYFHHLLLQKSDGRFYLLLWHDIALTDTSVRPFRRLPLAPPMPATIAFQKSIARARLHVPNDHEGVVQEWRGPLREIRLGVLDRVMVLEIETDGG